MIRPLVIGYGNALRGDDGIGPAVAVAVAARDPLVRSVSVPMLLPEHAALVAEASIAVFVDARVGPEPGRVRVEEMAGAEESGAFGHLLSAAALTAMARRLYGWSGPAYHVSVDAECFDLGAPLSPRVAAAAGGAVNAALEILSSESAAG